MVETNRTIFKKLLATEHRTGGDPMSLAPVLFDNTIVYLGSKQRAEKPSAHVRCASKRERPESEKAAGAPPLPTPPSNNALRRGGLPVKAAQVSDLRAPARSSQRRPQATFDDALLIGISSPRAKTGVLYGEWERHWGNDDSETLVWVAASRAMNPTLDPAIVEQAYVDDPAAAASEYGAEWRSDLATFLDRDVILRAVAPGCGERLPVEGVSYVAFADPSGGSGDSFTLAIAHRTDDGRVLLDCLRERRPPFSPDDVCREYAAVLKSYRLATVTGDFYGGTWPGDRFAAHSVAYHVSARSKSEIYLATLPIFHAKDAVELLDLPRLASQLAALERRVGRGGRESVDHPPGRYSRDDCANAACGALLLAHERQAVACDLSINNSLFALGAWRDY